MAGIPAVCLHRSGSYSLHPVARRHLFALLAIRLRRRIPAAGRFAHHRGGIDCGAQFRHCFCWPGAPSVPRSIPFIFLLLALVPPPARACWCACLRAPHHPANVRKCSRSQPQPVLIMGAGDAGAMIVRELKNNPHLGLEPVGFLDDDLGKHDVASTGFRCWATVTPSRRWSWPIRPSWSSSPCPPHRQGVREIVAICAQAGVARHRSRSV